MYTPMQLSDGIIMIGIMSAQIEYNSTFGQWILHDSISNITAMTEASQLSYALGKHNWTITALCAMPWKQTFWKFIKVKEK